MQGTTFYIHSNPETGIGAKRPNTFLTSDPRLSLVSTPALPCSPPLHLNILTILSQVTFSGQSLSVEVFPKYSRTVCPGIKLSLRETKDIVK